MSQYKFRVIRDDDEFILQAVEPIESDYPVWVFIELLDLWELCGREAESGPRYNVAIECASPGFAGEGGLRDAGESMGQDAETMAEYPPEVQAELLRDYGLKACIWQRVGNNKAKLLREAKKELIGVNCLFGFYLDRVENAIGSTGWDFMKGDLWRAVREEREAEQSERL